ncbi:retrovirus-related pol polyprotein from transposon TNT 1-94 [Tanacetum coccineum]
MTRNLKLLSNFVEKFLGTIKFGNDQIAPIIGYGDLLQGKITIKRVYYVEGLNHNLFSVGQFCDANLEVAFRKSTCYILDLKGNDLLTGSRGTDLYSITLQDTTTPNPICLMAKATSSQAWSWHRHLSHLNFDTINLLSKNDIVTGLLKLKFVKDQLCSSCELGKAKRKSFKTKTTSSSKRRLLLFYTSTYTHFLRSKDETPKVLIDFLRLVQRGLHAQVRIQLQQRVSLRTVHCNTRHEEKPTTSSNGAVIRSVIVSFTFWGHYVTSSISPPLNIPTKPAPASQAPIHILLVTPTENINQAESQDKNVQVEEDEFVNIFSTPGVKAMQEERSSVSVIDVIGIISRPGHYAKKHYRTIEIACSKGVIYQSPRGIFINQAKCAQEILIKHSMTSCDSIGTPMATKHLDADVDAKATISISCNPVQLSRTKHIDVRYHFIKEQVYVSLRRLGMRCMTPAELEIPTNESA